jgi:hypothetical protein
VTKLAVWTSPYAAVPTAARWRDQTELWLRLGYTREVRRAGLVVWTPPVWARPERRAA